jgi:hypothetical protein
MVLFSSFQKLMSSEEIVQIQPTSDAFQPTEAPAETLPVKEKEEEPVPMDVVPEENPIEQSGAPENTDSAKPEKKKPRKKKRVDCAPGTTCKQLVAILKDSYAKIHHLPKAALWALYQQHMKERDRSGVATAVKEGLEIVEKFMDIIDDEEPTPKPVKRTRQKSNPKRQSLRTMKKIKKDTKLQQLKKKAKTDLSAKKKSIQKLKEFAQQ